MPTNIDTLQIEINAKASKANDAIDRLVGKLDRLSISLNKMNTANLNGLSSGIQRLGTAMQTMNSVKTSDFTRLATNLQKLGSINVSAINSASVSMSHLARGFKSLGVASANSQQVVEMAKSLGKLGGANVQKAITNIPQLATTMKNLMTTLSKSPKVSNNVIQMANAMANLASQGSKVGTASRSISNGLNRTYTSTVRASKGFKGLTSVIGMFYARYFLIMRALRGLWKSITGMADYIEAFNYFNVAMGKIGSDWSHQFEQYGYKSAEAYADSFSDRLTKSLKGLSGVSIELDAKGNGLLTETGLKNLGLNIREVTQYASQLASVTNSVGLTGEASLAAASALTKLGADMSSLFNMDYSQVMNNLQSGIIGQSRALYRYGLDITNATLQTKAYELGLTKSVSEMSQMEKMQLRLLIILQDSRVAWGDLANTINSPSNMIRQFKNNLKETGMVLGQLFTPLLQNILPAINGLTIALKRLFVNMANIMGIKLNIEDYGQGYTETEDSVEDLTDDYEDLTDAAKEYKNQAMKFDEINPIKEPDTSSSDTSGLGGNIDLTEEILNQTTDYEKAWQEAYDKMQTKAEKFADGISKALKPISTIFEDIAKGDWLKLGKDTSKLVTSIFNFFSNAIKKVDWGKLGTNIGKFFKGVEWGKVFKSVGKTIVLAIEGAITAYMSMFKTAPIETAIISALALMKLVGLGSAISTAISSALLGHTIPLKKGIIGLALVAGTIYMAQSPNVLKRYIGSAIAAALAVLTFGASVPLALGFGAITVAAVGIKDLIKKAVPWFFEDNVIPYEAEVQVTLGASFEKVAQAVEKLNSGYETYVENAEDVITESKTETIMIDKLWKKYKKLADKTDKTNSEKQQLIAYSKELVEKIPELSGMINTETGEYTAQKKEINKIIKATKEKIRVEALQSVYTESLKQQVKAEMEIQKIRSNPDYIKALENQAKAQERLNAAQAAEDKFYKEHTGEGNSMAGYIAQYEELQAKTTKAENAYIGATSALKSWDDELKKAEDVLKSAKAEVSLYEKELDKTSTATSKAKSNTTKLKNEIKNTADNSNSWAVKINNALSGLVIPKLSINKKNLVDQAKSVTEEMQSYFDKLKLPDFGDIIISTKSDKSIEKRNPLKQFADGGFASSGQIFVAREAGPELVGTMAGHTAIASNDQIVVGIAEGIYPAVYSAVANAMSGFSGNTNVNVTLEGDAKKLFKSVQKQANNYMMQTGKPAFT